LINGYQAAQDGGVLLVDVGGGMGYDLQMFLSHFLETSGTLVLQDLPSVIHKLAESSLPGIIKMSQDFFKEQAITDMFYLFCCGCSLTMI